MAMDTNWISIGTNLLAIEMLVGVIHELPLLTFRYYYQTFIPKRN
jgi:hypothetical protein